MPKRFNNLNAALKLLRPLTGDGQAADLPDSTALGFYQAVRAGKKKVEYGDRKNDSLPKSLVTYTLIPFGTPVANSPRVKVTMSERSEAVVTTKAGLSAAVLNVSKTDGDIKAAVNLERFVPAKATVRLVGAAKETTPTSKLTGRKYKAKDTDSYTYPFGFGVKDANTNKGFKDVKSEIITEVEKSVANTRRFVSFSPEIYL